MRNIKGLIIVSTAGLVMFSVLLYAAWAAAAPQLVKDPGSVPADTFIINDEALKASWPTGNLRRSGEQSPQWKPVPSAPKSYFSTQRFAAYGGSGGLWIDVRAGEAMMQKLQNPGTFKESTESLISANRSQDSIKFLKDCSGKGYPYLYHYLSSGDGSGTMHSYHEGFSGYARGYFIMFFFKASNKKEHMPPPQWLEGVFFAWLDRLPALDGPGSGAASVPAGPGGVSGKQAAATAAAGAAIAGGLALQKLLGGSPLPAESGGSAGGSEARGSEEGENRRRGYRYWMRTTAHSRRLKADGRDSVWVYARVESDDPEADKFSLTQGINFSGGGSHGHWLAPGGVQFTGGYAVVPVTASPPEGNAAPPGEAYATVTAWAEGPEGRVSGSLDLVLESETGGRIETRTHQDRRSLRPDGRDGIWLYAAVALSDTASGEDRQAANDSLTFRAAGEGAGLVMLGQPQDIAGWKAVYVQASSPDQGNQGGAGRTELPGRVAVAISARAGEREIRSVVDFDLLPVPVLAADRDVAEFRQDTEGPVEIKVYVNNPGPGPWEFQADFDSGREVIARAEVRQEGASSAAIALSRADSESGPGPAGYRRSVIRVTARQDETTLQKDLNVLLAVEGIDIIHRTYPDRQFLLAADGKSSAEIDFAVFRLKGGELVSDGELAGSLAFEDQSEGTEVKNAVRAGELEIAFSRIRGGNIPYGVYTFRMRREVPADGRVLPARISASVPGLGAEFSRTFQLGIETTDMSPGSRAWEEEIRRTEEFIDRFTPEGYRPNFRRILENRKYTLGVDGLYKLRRQIWNVAQDIVLAQGKSYEAEAAWQEYCHDVANWVKWLGDQAFSIIAGSVLGPGYALATCVTKDALVDALGRWNAGESFEDYAENRVQEVLQGIGEYVVNPDELKKRFGYVKAYGIYFCWRFMFNLGTKNDEGKPRSAADAAWQAVKDCTTTAVDNWITGICEKEAIAKGWKKGQDGGDSTGGEDAGGDGKPAAEPGTRGMDGGSDPAGAGDSGLRSGGKDARGADTGEAPSGDSTGSRRKWEQDAGERRRKWEQDAAERREKWEKEAGERREKWKRE